MEIDVKYLPGQRVWAIHKYPAGAKVWEGEVYETTVRISKDRGPVVTYRFNDGFKVPFIETELFDTEEEALAVKEEWCSRPDVVERAERLANGLKQIQEKLN